MPTPTLTHSHPRTIAYVTVITLATFASAFAMGAAIASHIYNRITGGTP